MYLYQHKAERCPRNSTSFFSYRKKAEPMLPRNTMSLKHRCLCLLLHTYAQTKVVISVLEAVRTQMPDDGTLPAAAFSNRRHRASNMQGQFLLLETLTHVYHTVLILLFHTPHLLPQTCLSWQCGEAQHHSQVHAASTHDVYSHLTLALTSHFHKQYLIPMYRMNKVYNEPVPLPLPPKLSSV